MTHLNDPEVVRAQYADERGLRARQAIWEDYSGDDPREALFDKLRSFRPRRALELGGGDGWLSAWMRDELGSDVTLVDQSERMVELARERGVSAEVGDVHDLRFDDGSFDTVVAAWMLYHVTDIDRGLGEIARVLEPGGRLIANTNSRRHAEELRELIDYPVEARETSFSRENGEELLRRHFRHVERADVNGLATVHDRQLLVDYRDSLMVIPSGAVPADVPIPFVVSSRGVLFVATK